ncbi:MAG TPA: efflux RND transporter periplasmic adaptor subunit [Burkholderiales bacterium]|jgi:cobalt-zinc-cadmium efflux system membrane fusion protein|nr:efflux RND transporter periplasmic adaptor subunit [Burkholderiales bacterium]
MRRGWVFLSAVLLLAAACRREKDKASEPGASPEEEHAHEGAGGERVTLSPEALKAVVLKTAPVERRRLEEQIRATAVIKPNEYRLAHVSPRIGGRAIEVKALLGDAVKPNEPLALLDSLELGEKKSAFLQARTNLEVARRNYAREERLFKQRISSEKEYLEAKGEFERSEAAFRAAREALRLVGLTDEEIDGIACGGKGHPLSHFPLIAPFAGTVVEQHIAIGELVEPNETPYTIADLSTVWVLLDVFEKDIAHVRVGSAVQVAVDAYPGEMFRGTVAYLSNLLDPSTRTALARVEIDNRDGRLRPGMFATATISIPSASTGPGSFVVPRDAVQQVRGRAVAFVEEQPGTYRMRELGLGKDSGPEVEVLAGLTEGERVVTEGAFYLKSTLLKEEMGEHD